MKKRISMILALACVFTLLVGTMAYFTDRASYRSTATVGNIDLVFTDQSLASESYGVKDELGTHSDIAPQAKDSVWGTVDQANGKMLVTGGILNPGDVIDMDYKVANTGTKSIDVKQVIVLTSSVAIADNMLAISVDGEIETPTSGGSAGAYTYTYELDKIVLNGSAEKDGTSAEKAYEVALVFGRLAKNEYMNATVSVDLTIYAKQHRNTTDADWAAIANYQTINN